MIFYKLKSIIICCVFRIIYGHFNLTFISTMGYVSGLIPGEIKFGLMYGIDTRQVPWGIWTAVNLQR